MTPTQVSARFAAYVWYMNVHGDEITAKEEANRFARRNWSAFLPCSQDGLGKLLIRLARGRRKSKAASSSRRSGAVSRRRPSINGLAAG
jgi:hypothetical protein